jgi:uncharacterized membrane protein
MLHYTALALILCLITALSRVLLMRGMAQSNPLTGMVASLLVGCLVLDGAALLTADFSTVTWQGVGFFAMIGVIAPPVVRYLTYIGIHRVGPAHSDPVRSLTPFFAILFAILFLGETANISIVGGTILIFLGVLFLSRNAAANSKFRKTDLLFPLAAAILAGGVANLRKFGTGLLDSPLIAAAVAATSAVFVFAVFLVGAGKLKDLKVNRSSGIYFLLSGICTSLTDVLDIMILQKGKVSIVSPLLASSPLFVIVLSHFLLKELEKVTAKLVIGALLIFAGVEVILIYGRS